MILAVTVKNKTKVNNFPEIIGLCLKAFFWSEDRWTSNEGEN